MPFGAGRHRAALTAKSTIRAGRRAPCPGRPMPFGGRQAAPDTLPCRPAMSTGESVTNTGRRARLPSGQTQESPAGEA
eukprot:9081542-Pyramimonas_sp.AAC.1